MFLQHRLVKTVSDQFQCQSMRKHLNFLTIDSIKALYEYLLNREYAEPLALEHTMERKAVRSPSMRLRFGRRSDPDVPLITRVRLIRCLWLATHSSRVSILSQENEIENEIEQKAIRSPSMRLRFGRRSDSGFYNDVSVCVWLPCTGNYLSIFLLETRSHYSLLTSHSVERHKGRHRYVFASANETHPCLTMRWESWRRFKYLILLSCTFVSTKFAFIVYVCVWRARVQFAAWKWSHKDKFKHRKLSGRKSCERKF